MATTIERLTAVLEADIRGFSKNMKEAETQFQRRSAAIEARQEKLERRLSTGFGKVGRGLTNALVGGAALYGLERFVAKVAATADELQNTSEALKIGTNELQAWGLMAAKNGTDQAAFNGAMEKFGKTLGLAKEQGGKARKELESLGISVNDTVTAAFYKLSDAVATTANQNQRVALVTANMGKSAAGLVPVLEQGSAAIRAQTADLVAQGKIISGDTIRKIDDLGDKWTEVKRQLVATGANVLGGFADEFGTFADQMQSPQFQNALKEFGSVMADVAVAVAKIAPVLPNIVGALVGARIGASFGPAGAGVGAIAGAIAPELNNRNDANSLQHQRDFIQSKLDKLGKNGPKSLVDPLRVQLDRLDADIDRINAKTAGTGGASPRGKPPPTSDRPGGATVEETEAARIEKEYRRNVLEEIASFERDFYAKQKQLVEDQLRFQLDASETAREERRRSIEEQTRALVHAAEGTSDYYAVLRDAIEETATLDIERVDDWEKSQLDAMALLEDNWVGYEQAVTDIHNAAEAQRKGIDARRKSDKGDVDEAVKQTKANEIALNDALRDGALEVGKAALHGFGAMKDAAASALEKIAELAFEMLILKPLINSVFGAGGTTGIFAGLFATGGRIGSGQWGIVGDKGPEPVRARAGGIDVLPNSSLRTLDLPRPAAGAGAADSSVHLLVTVAAGKEFDARVRQVGGSEARGAIVQYDRGLPSRVAAINADPYAR